MFLDTDDAENCNSVRT